SGTDMYDANGVKVSDTWIAADGSHGSEVFHADGSVTGTADDGQGKVTVTEYDSPGQKSSDTWTATDGSHGSDDFNTGRGDVYYADGSHKVLRDWGDGSGKSQLFDASGNEIRDDWWNSDGTGSWQINTYDASGFNTGDTYGGNDGSGQGYDTYNPDGS